MRGLHFVFLIEHKTILLILWVTRQRNSELNLVFLFIDRRAEKDKKKVCYFVQTQRLKVTYIYPFLFLQRLCVEARVGNVTCSRKVCSLMQIISYASSLTLSLITFLVCSRHLHRRSQQFFGLKRVYDFERLFVTFT